MNSARAFLVLWSKPRVAALRGTQLPTLTMLFGGPHLSLPSLSKFGVRSGDTVFPVFAHERRLDVMCSAAVQEVEPIRPFLIEHFGISEAQAEGSLWELWPVLKQTRPEVAHLRDDECLSEAARCKSTPLRFDRPISPEVLGRLAFCSSKGERAIKHVTDGLLTSTLSIQNGYFRLASSSAQDLPC